MASIWRPFEEAELEVREPEEQEEVRTNSRMKIKVGESERELVLNAYLHCSSKGWNAVLKKVREDIEQEPLNSRLVDYYLETADTTAIKRVQRIVREQLKGQAAETSSTLTTSNAVSQRVIRNQTRYARKRTPEERRQQKMAEFVSSEENENVGDVKDVLPLRKKGKTVREASLESQTAHTEMCKKATAGIALMERVLQKLETKIDEM